MKSYLKDAQTAKKIAVLKIWMNNLRTGYPDREKLT